jgi:arylsulfatase A-like enzyme
VRVAKSGGVPPITAQKIVRRLAALFLLASLSCNASDSTQPPEAIHSSRKNIVLITLDALRQDHLSAFGYSRQTSPNIDWLSKHGAVFRNVVPSGCSTKASLTSLYTSMDYRHHHVLRHGAVLNDEYSTLAEIFKQHGYDTAAFIGTPHLRGELNYDQGFDLYEDFSGFWLQVKGVVQRLIPDALVLRIPGADRFLERMGYITAGLVVDAMLRYLAIRPAGDTPFFVYAHLEEPHPPWIHGSPWLTEKEEREQFFLCTHVPSDEELKAVSSRTRENLIAKYDGAIRFADEQIGRLISALRNRGLLENSVIAVSTDHGLELLERYSATHGYNPFDEVVRTFLVLYDGSGRIGRVDTNRIQGRIFDIGPTLLGLANLEPPPGLDGIDLLNDPERLPPYAFSKCYNAEVVRSLDFKLFEIRKVQGRNHPEGMPIGLQFYSLREDPGETRDVRERYPRRFEEMREELEAYRADLEKEFLPEIEVEDKDLSRGTYEMLKRLGYIEE